MRALAIFVVLFSLPGSWPNTFSGKFCDKALASFEFRGLVYLQSG